MVLNLLGEDIGLLIFSFTGKVIFSLFRSIIDLASYHIRYKTGSFWAISEDPSSGFTRKEVRSWLGDFSEEKVVAKWVPTFSNLLILFSDV